MRILSVLSTFCALALAASVTRANYYTDFEACAENQVLAGSNGWVGSTEWKVVTLDGNKVLRLTPGAGEQELSYQKKNFTGVNEGYTVQLRMRFDTGSSALSQYSGFRVDAATAKPTYGWGYDDRRFAFEATGRLSTGWSNVAGSGLLFQAGRWYFLRVRRSGADPVSNNGGNLRVWASEFPITEKNAGTLILDTTPPPDTNPQSAALGAFWLNGVAFGTDTVYVDELSLAQGDSIAAGLLAYSEAPYDVCKDNYLAANYMQALWDPVKKWLAFNEYTFGEPGTRRNGFYFLEGQGRAINAYAHEAANGPVARLDLMADMAQGIINARVPGSEGRHYFMVEGREALSYVANSDHFELHWLQDSSLAQYRVYVETRPDYLSTWTLVNPANLTKTTTALDGGTRETYSGSGVTVTLDRWCGVEDYAPTLSVATSTSRDIRLRLNSAAWSNTAGWTYSPVQSILSPARTDNATSGNPNRNLTTAEKRLLLRNDYKTYAARCPRPGWEAQTNWSILDTYYLAAWDAAKVPRLTATTADSNRIFSEVALTWTAVTATTLRGALYAEIDPNDNYFVTASADTVATGAAHNFGIKPYSPVRTGLQYCQTLGLCAAATTLVTYQHSAAATVRAAAIEAFDAAVKSEGRGYYSENVNHLIEAAWWLKQIEPTRFAYTTLVNTWAARLQARIPSGYTTPMWTDTAGRYIRGMYFAHLVTGNTAYKTAADNGLASFTLPAGTDFEKFMFNGVDAPFNGYGCQAAASLLGLWGWQRTQVGGALLANRLVTQSAKWYHCDTGFVPYWSYNCHDLLPYYLGISLKTPFPTPPPVTIIGLNDYVRYDASGTVTTTTRPAIPFPPNP